MRAGDLADLRAATPGRTCPTGRLPDGSCWEILPGAATRETDPPAAQRLAPHGMGGCCLCCPGCQKARVIRQRGDSCMGGGSLALTPGAVEVCCVGTEAENGYGAFENYDLNTGVLTGLREWWWARTTTGVASVARRRTWSSAGDPLVDLTRTSTSGSELRCNRAMEFMAFPRFSGGAYTVGFGGPDLLIEGGLGTLACPLPCPGDAARANYTSTAATALIQLGFAPGACQLSQRAYAVIARSGTSLTCSGRCQGVVLGPGVPEPPQPLPGGGDSAARSWSLLPSGRIVVPGGATRGQSNAGGCSGCGGDGGL